MLIPAWVDRGQPTAAKRASARLKYLMHKLAFDITGKASVRALAPLVGLDYSTIYHYIRLGAFTETAAEKIVAHINRRTLKVAMLTQPLTINCEK